VLDCLCIFGCRHVDIGPGAKLFENVHIIKLLIVNY
jgi:hypothetical protein